MKESGMNMLKDMEKVNNYELMDLYMKDTE